MWTPAALARSVYSPVALLGVLGRGSGALPQLL